MNGPGNEFLAGACLPVQEHGGISRRNDCNLVEHFRSAGLLPTMSSKMYSELISDSGNDFVFQLAHFAESLFLRGLRGL